MKKIFSASLMLTVVIVILAFNVNKKNDIANHGYDVVSYIKSNKAMKGDKKYFVQNESSTYYFSSVENKNLFKANPEKYLPVYGGWCAYAMGKDGSLVDINPETFKVINGKTYLFYNKFVTNTLNDWNKDEKNLKLKADKNWKKHLKK